MYEPSRQEFSELPAPNRLEMAAATMTHEETPVFDSKRYIVVPVGGGDITTIDTQSEDPKLNSWVPICSYLICLLPVINCAGK